RSSRGQFVPLADGKIMGIPVDQPPNTGPSNKVKIFDFRDNGDACEDKRQCRSAECKGAGTPQGMCCDSACDSLCDTCKGSERVGGGPDGNCGSKAVGVPETDCAPVVGETCGFIGECNGLTGGQAACALHPDGEICNDETSCVPGAPGQPSTAQYVDDICDGVSHFCEDQATTPCLTGYTCRDDQGGNCVTNCIQDDWCTTDTHYCDTDLEKCKLKKDNGVACSASGQCKTGNCVDGVCCNTSCTGMCQSCKAADQVSGADGFCGDRAPGQFEGGCAPDGTACGPVGTCNGLGGCTLHPAGEVCNNETTCVAGSPSTVEYVDDKCNGTDSACQDGGTASCAAGYTCQNGVGCLTSCAQNSDCTTATHFCDSNDAKCKPKKNNGFDCFGDPGMCATGNCVDGYCCDTACAGLCASCASAQTGLPNGTCGAREAGKTEAACNPDGTACGPIGTCDGNFGCTLTAAGTVCKVETGCSDSTHEYKDDTCSGSASTCPDAGTQACATGYTCKAGSGCLTSCTAHSDCTTATHFCDTVDGLCKLKKPNGQDCFGDTQLCATGNCVDGYCCDTACTGTCQSCRASDQVSGVNGQCGDRAAGQAEAACNPVSGQLCGPVGTCDGTGGCAIHAMGELCKTETGCSDTTHEFVDDTCDGIATSCPDAGTAACATGYTCQAGTGCLSSCASNSDCTSTHWCDTLNDQKCKVKRDDGLACDSSNQCKTGFCVDGVCCENACGGTCQACSNLLTGQPNGQCEPIPVNADPQSECEPPTAASTCGFTGNCNGSASAPACQYWSNTTECAAQTCASSTSQRLASNCSGTGAGCPTGTVQNCSAGYLCKGGACLTACTGDGDCDTGYFCNSGGQCVADLVKGVSGCDRDAMCATGLVCSTEDDGSKICCDNACTGDCRSCLNTRNGGLGDGTCGYTPANTDPDADCPDGTPNACDATGMCAGNGTCQQFRSAGTLCGNGQVCDNGSVTVQKCTGIDTTCATLPVGTGNCGGFACAANGVDCRTSCTDNTDCAGTSFCGSDNQCKGTLTPGSSCFDDSECASGFCADVGIGDLESGAVPSGDPIPGVCCDQDCTGECTACKASLKQKGQDGKCETVTPNTDERDDCPQDTSNVCGLNGLCGNGSCALTPNGASCGESSCVGNSVQGQICNGNGTCIDSPGTTACEPYVCSEASGEGACTNPCQNDDECQNGYYCSSGTCLKKLANGASCDDNNLCGSGFCVDGLCCDTSCRGQCQACNLPNNEGICTAVEGAPVGDRPACDFAGEECGGVCDGVSPDACTYPVNGSSCGAATCDDGVASSSSCNGRGECLVNDDEDCAPYACGDDDECLTKCEIDDDCSQGYACDDLTGNCTPAAVATMCSEDRLQSVGRNAQTACRPYLCDLASGACAIACAATNDCQEGFVCEPTTKACITAPPESSIDEGSCSCRTVGTGNNRTGLGALALAFMLAGIRLSNRRVRSRRKAVTVSATE
ncbi:MAG TPA: hypothetical protein VM686_26150, partial [Polyangiaceae bacterium]|nr:hypothetical protein [Polyangiaceae bacterium]